MAWLQPRVLAAGILCLLAGPTALAAQGLAVGVHAGQFVPSQDLYDTIRGSANQTGDYRLGSGSLVGGAITGWIGQRFGLVASAGRTTADLTHTRASGEEFGLGEVKLTYGAFQATAILASPEAVLQPYVSAGLGLVKRKGDAFPAGLDGTRVGFVIGTGLRVKVVGVAFWGGAELMDYSSDWAPPNGLPKRSFLQRDFQLKAGVTVPVLGRA